MWDGYCFVHDKLNAKILAESRSGFTRRTETYSLDDKDKLKVDRSPKILEFWNEGFTQWLAVKTARDYLRRSPFVWRGFTINAEEFESRLPFLYNNEPYAVELLTTDNVIAWFAKDTGLDKETIGNALIQAYMSRSGHENFLAAVKETFDTDFSERLINLVKLEGKNRGEAAAALISRYFEEHPYIFLQIL